MQNSTWKAGIAMAAALTLSACGTEKSDGDFEWAVNVGGQAYTAVDGTRFVAEEHVTGGDPGSIPEVKGASDVELYRS